MARCGGRALRPSSPKWLLLRSTVVTVLLNRKTSAKACKVGTRQWPSWQPSWHAALRRVASRVASRHVLYITYLYHSLSISDFYISCSMEVKWTLRHGAEMPWNPKPSHDARMVLSQVSTIAHRCAKSRFRRLSRGRCGGRALRPLSPKWFLLRWTVVTVLLTRKTSAKACKVGTRQWPSWQPSRDGTVSAFHCSCAKAPAWSQPIAGTSDMPGLSDVPNMNQHDFYVSLHHPPCFNSLYQCHSLQFLFNAKTFSMFISHPERGWGSRRGEWIVNLKKQVDFEVKS